MITTPFEKKIGKLFSVIGNPFRIQILLTIGKGEACVCHLEALLGKRQAFISQHLMALRKEGFLETRRSGKYVFYRLADLETLEMLRKAGKLAGLADEQLPDLIDPVFSPSCCCPNCESQTIKQTNKSK